MSPSQVQAPITLSIAAVERDTGLSKDTLRVWERRYGFPAPARDGVGERVYTLQDVDKLRILKRLLDAGHRAGRIVPLALEELHKLNRDTVDLRQRVATVAPDSVDLQTHLALARSHDVGGLRIELTLLLSRLGVARFLDEVIAPLNVAIGDAWLRGQLEVFEEHMVSEVVQGVLRGAIAAIPEPEDADAPCVLLSTLPGEPHGLGLLMAQALLALEGCRCVSLGVQTPLWDIVLAARALRADIVGLSFTGCTSPNQIIDGLTELRLKLPAPVRLWAGGCTPVLQRRRIDGVLPFATLHNVPIELQRLRGAARHRDDSVGAHP